MNQHIDFSINLVKKLIREQFPEWAHLEIKPVEISGHDNRMFRLGNDFIIRLPSAYMYEDKVFKEQKWLPQLAPYLSVKIPQPVALGKPTSDYPWHWSVYTWLDGQSANSLDFSDTQLCIIADELAQCIKELHVIPLADQSLLPGEHNFYRGGHLSVYDNQTQGAIQVLQDNLENIEALKKCWQKSLQSQWNTEPVWIHGDMSAGNFLIKNGHLYALIDFGGMGIGDPACDLVIAWTFFKNKSREIFKQSVGLDQDTWNRAKGWALWKAFITLQQCENKNSEKAQEHIRIIQDVLKD